MAFFYAALCRPRAAPPQLLPLSPLLQLAAPATATAAAARARAQSFASRTRAPPLPARAPRAGTAAARAQAAAPHLSGGGTATAQDPAAATAPPPAETLRVFVKRVEDASYAEVVVGAGASVAALAKAASSELGVDAPRGAVTLTREGASTPLDSTLSVAEALASGALAPRAKLFLVVHAPAPPAGEAEAAARYERLRDTLRAARAEPLEGGGASPAPRSCACRPRSSGRSWALASRSL